MTIRFNPNDANTTLPPGKYPAVIEGLEPKTSKNGSPYLKAQIRVYGDREVVVFDTLMLDGPGLFRLKNLASACGMKAEFDSGTLDEGKLIQQNVTVELLIEESDDYGDRNKIRRYEAKAAGSPVVKPKQTKPASSPDTITADDMPF